MTQAAPVETVQEIHLKDYTPPSHLIDKTDLTFDLIANDNVVVDSVLQVRANPQATGDTRKIVLNGAPETVPEGSEAPTMDLLGVKINGQPLDPAQIKREGETLTLDNLPDQPFKLEIKTRINPEANRSLQGLYTSGGKFTTQCEAEGFRNMTFYLDRPDVLSEFTTTIIADKGKFEQLLSNGNPGPKTTRPDGREQITWHDPFKKPSYLFALVAGNLAMKETMFKTMSCRPVSIKLYCDKGEEGKLDHALKAVEQSMAWDERRFGREYDLDLFQVVAVSDFNMGAMENKGLNIFNTSAVLADPKTATDDRYEFVQAVIGHEYFHNWSGDRVTCRDWFQLSLKEGFTVFRDQEFTSDLNSRAVKRIDDVTGMRTVQFAEDAGAMAHPIRPASVGTIDNFYTTTVYEKGAEVIRMIHTLLGEEAFRKGSDLYFARHDGQAVTTEDFVKAMSDASGVDLSQFERTWYNQAGTPTLTVRDDYDTAKKEYRLTIKQSTPPTPGQPTKDPFHIPVRIGLLDSQGKDMPLDIDSSQTALLTQGDVLNLKDIEQTFVFKNVAEKPTPSLLRNWSAPVKVDYPYTRQQLTFLMAHDSDGFNCWDAGQKLGENILKDMVSAYQKGQPVLVDQGLIDAFKRILTDPNLDPSLASQALVLPSVSYMMQLYPEGQVDVDAIFNSRKAAREQIGKALEAEFLAKFQASRDGESRPYDWNMKDVGDRAIKNLALSYLVTANPTKYLPLAITQFDLNHNMTDVRGAMRHIIDHADPAMRQAKLDAYYQEHQTNPLAMNQWFVEQALVDNDDALSLVKSLLAHPSYDAKNPNAIRSLIGAFSVNIPAFHKKDGSGYAFLVDQIIEIDKFNPNAASGLAKKFSNARIFDPTRRALMQAQLERLRDNATSPNTKEVVAKTLASLPQPAAAAAMP